MFISIDGITIYDQSVIIALGLGCGLMGGTFALLIHDVIESVQSRFKKYRKSKNQNA